MARLDKLFNANYLHDVPAAMQVVNEKNRAYVDRFVSENYNKLSSQFKSVAGIINSSCYGSLDKLNETIWHCTPMLIFVLPVGKTLTLICKTSSQRKKCVFRQRKQSKVESCRMKKVLTKTI